MGRIPKNQGIGVNPAGPLPVPRDDKGQESSLLGVDGGQGLFSLWDTNRWLKFASRFSPTRIFGDVEEFFEKPSVEASPGNYEVNGVPVAKIHVYQEAKGARINCRKACLEINRRYQRHAPGANRKRPSTSSSLPKELYNARVATVMDPKDWNAGRRPKKGEITASSERVGVVIKLMEDALSKGYLPPILISHKRGLHYICACGLERDDSGKVVAIRFIDPGSILQRKGIGVLRWDEEAGNFVKQASDKKGRVSVPDLTYRLVGVHCIHLPPRSPLKKVVE